MSYGYISLSLGSFSITIDTFTSTNYPRDPGEFREPSLNTAQNLIAPGNPYGMRERFGFTGLVTKSQALDLLSLFREHRRLIDSRQDGKILLYDTTWEYQDLGATPTRGRAPSPFDTVVTSGGYCHWFSGFYVFMLSQPIAQYYGQSITGEVLVEVPLLLIEAGEKVPV